MFAHQKTVYKKPYIFTHKKNNYNLMYLFFLIHTQIQLETKYAMYLLLLSRRQMFD